MARQLIISCGCGAPSRRFTMNLLVYMYYMIATLALLSHYLVIFANAAGDNFFCGTSWNDASGNCDNRQPCPGATDDECTQPGHVCFGDTICSAAAGHGERFKFMALAPLVDVPYADPSNIMFCGSWWAGAQQSCTVATHCGTPGGADKPCPSQGTCFETSCHLQDLVTMEFGDDWREMVIASVGKGGSGSVSKLSPDDPRRNQYCGLSWNQASAKCTQHCMGDDDECPGGQKCFGDTNCYYEEDLVPSMAPIITLTPTRSPVLRSDPNNGSFCGNSWGIAIQNCSPDTHCRTDNNCPERGEKCHHRLPGCNLADMGSEPIDPWAIQDWRENPSDPKNFNFCGNSWDDAKTNCNLDRHCPEYVCEDRELSCFVGLNHVGADHCNAFDILAGNTRAPTDKPTSLAPTLPPSDQPTTNPPSVPPTPSPSKKPTVSPTTSDPSRQPSTSPTTAQPTKAKTNLPTQIIHGLCAASYAELQEIYRTAKPCSNVNPCNYAQICFPNFEVSAFASPTKTPTMPPITMTTTPTEYPTYWYTYSPTQSDEKPSVDSGSIIVDESTTSQIQTLQSTEKANDTQNAEEQNDAKTSQQVSESIDQKPTSKDEVQSQEAQDLDISLDTPKGASFYCASTLEELKETCGTAKICDLANPCPAGLGCIQYDNCQESHSDKTAAFNYFPDLCPLGFVGQHAHEGDCQQYYDCDDGLLKASHMCKFGLFDNRRGKCVGKGLVNAKCESGIDIMEEIEQQVQDAPGADNNETSEMDSGDQNKLSNYIPDLCPVGLVGLHAPEGDCRQYYECNDGLLETARKCAMAFMFDNRQGKCVDQRNVNYKCESVIEDDEKNGSVPQNSESDSNCPNGLVGYYAQNPDCSSFYECDDGIIVTAHQCDTGFLFDNVEGGCLSKELVDENCFSRSGEESKGPSSVSYDASKPGNKQTSTEGEMLVADSQNKYDLDLCPLNFNGFHAKGDCTEYYECYSGWVGIVQNCKPNYKFDKGRDECIAAEFVNEYCYGPAVLATVDDKQNNQGSQYEQNNNQDPEMGDGGESFVSDDVPRPSQTPTTTHYRPSSYAGGLAYPWNPTANPATEPNIEGSAPSKNPDEMYLWIRDYENSNDGAATRGTSCYHSCMFMTILLSTSFIVL